MLFYITLSKHTILYIIIYFVYYNWCKIHKSLSVTPAMQACLANKVMTLKNTATLSDIEVPKKRSAYNLKGRLMKSSVAF